VSANGYDSRRRRNARGAAYWTAWRRRFRLGLIATLVALAVFAITYDHMAKRLDFPPPVQGHTVDVTTTLPPHPATTGSHP
jgi:hypothetical protein